MLWNEIRDHIRDRLPAIIDFTLYAVFTTIIAAVLLGLTWLYVNYGIALFLVALVLIWIASGFAGPRAPTYLDDPGSSRSTALPPPGGAADRSVEPGPHETSTGVARSES